ncbi:MAG: Rne/Rng family ribonuclease, partial [Bryobacteraceae bacterium]|nr:Rne/Rng family ribonuclease [Bryobacteraceae bacterium]
MTKELVISANAHETKVALLEDDQLVEIYFQRAHEYSLAGSVHKGRVTRVLPGMQSAFVDLGLERDTFLYVSDFFEESDEYEKLPSGPEERGGRQQKPVVKAAPAVVAAPAPAVVVAAQAPAAAGAGMAAAGMEESPAGERGGDDRDRRGGRRGRRRRGRGGRPLPESKFAETRTIVAAEPIVEEEPEAAPVAEAEEFPVLPGETLRKYKRGAGEAGEDTEETAGAIEAMEDDDRQDEEAASEPVETIAELAPEAPLPAAGAIEDVEVEQEAEAEAAAEDETEDIGSVEEVRELIPEDLLDQIQAQAEASVSGNGSGPAAVEAEEEIESDEDTDEEDASLEAAPEVDGEEGVEVEAESDEEDDEDTDDQGEEQAEAQGETVTAPGEAGVAGEEEGPEPALASMGSVGSSHREQTARFRGRRMRRRRGAPADVRTVGRDAKEREPREAREPRETREPREAREPRDTREPREAREPREGEAKVREGREGRDRDKPKDRDRDRERPPQTSISELLKEGQEIVVQIAKEPLGQKGARITSHIALPGRYCVYMPTVEHLGVSRKIASDEERQRLRKILQKHREGIAGGFIIRTAGEGKTEEQIAADIQYLSQLWNEIKEKAEKQKAPALLYHDVEVVQRLLRDQLTESFKAIWVDNEQLYESVVRFVQRMQPSMASRVKLYTRSVPVFDAFNITNELEKALRPKVWLKSGGYIVINQTEALVAIDINTGKYVGKSNRLEDTIVKTNIDACKEIVRQIRLRDLGGIIVVDFIDMDERKNRQKVMMSLEEAMRADRAPNKIVPFNEFGLVAITRKRVKQSLERALCSSCPTCEGSGYVKSVPTVVGEILIEAGKLAPHVDSKEVMLRVHPSVGAALKSKDTHYLEELEGMFKRPVLVTSDDKLHPE